MYTKYHYDIIGQDNHSFDLKFFLEKNQGWIIFCAFNFDKEEIIQRNGNSTNLQFLRLSLQRYAYEISLKFFPEKNQVWCCTISAHRLISEEIMQHDGITM